MRSWRLAINSNEAHAFSGITMQDLIDHFRLKELDGAGQHGRAWSTRNRYESYLKKWIEPRWGKQELAAIKTPIVEEWLEQLRPIDEKALHGEFSTEKGQDQEASRSWNKGQNPQHHGCALQSCDAMGVHRPESDQGADPRGWRSPKLQAGRAFLTFWRFLKCRTSLQIFSLGTELLCC